MRRIDSEEKIDLTKKITVEVTLGEMIILHTANNINDYELQKSFKSIEEDFAEGFTEDYGTNDRVGMGLYDDMRMILKDEGVLK